MIYLLDTVLRKEGINIISKDRLNREFMSPRMQEKGEEVKWLEKQELGLIEKVRVTHSHTQIINTFDRIMSGSWEDAIPDKTELFDDLDHLYRMIKEDKYLMRSKVIHDIVNEQLYTPDKEYVRQDVGKLQKAVFALLHTRE